MTEETKAVNVSISDDLDAWSIGDLCAFVGWDGNNSTGLVSTGDAYMGTIEAINGQMATMAYVDTFFNPTGGTCIVPLSQLREYNLPGTEDTTEDLDRLGNPDAPATNDDITPPADSVMP